MPDHVTARILTRHQPVRDTTYRAIGIYAEPDLPDSILLRLESRPFGGDQWEARGHRFFDAPTARLIAERLLAAADLIESAKRPLCSHWKTCHHVSCHAERQMRGLA